MGTTSDDIPESPDGETPEGRSPGGAAADDPSAGHPAAGATAGEESSVGPAAPGRNPGGEAPDDAASPDDASSADGEAPEGHAQDGKAQDGKALDGEAPDGDASDGGSPRDETPHGETTGDETLGDRARGGEVPDGALPGRGTESGDGTASGGADRDSDSVAHGRDGEDHDQDGDGAGHGGAAPAAPSRRRFPPLAAASLAAALLLVGGGGAWWASAAGDGSDSAKKTSSRTPEPLALDGYGDAGQPEREGIAVGEPNPYGTRYVFRGKVPEGPASAPAHLATGKVGKDEVARLAKALDVSGTPRADHGVWTVGGTRDGMSPALRVSQEAPGNWSYSAHGSPGGHKGSPSASEPGSAAEPGSPGESGAGSGRESGTGSATGPGSDKAVSEQRAKRAAEPVLDLLGLGDAELDARRLNGAVRVVTASPVVDELPTYGWQTNLEVGSDGRLVGGNGMLSKLTRTADYPLIGADAALKRLNDTVRAGRVPGEIGDCATPVPHHDGDTAQSPDAVDSSAPCEPGADAGAGSAKPAPEVIRSATFGLAATYVDGRQSLVPSWIFSARSADAADPAGATVVHPAIDPEFITTASGDDPVREEPGQAPSEDSGTPVEPGERNVTENAIGYSADGRTLTLHFTGGVCSAYTGTAKESADQVEVRITGRWDRPGRACIALAKDLETKVTLDRPLGDRDVVDAATGKRVPAV